MSLNLLAPYSFFNAVAGFPPTIMFSVSSRRYEPHDKDTLRNVREVDEFVCHVVDESMAQPMVKSAAEYAAEISEFEVLHLDTIASTDVRPLRLAHTPAAMECKVTQIVPVEGTTNTLVIGRVIRFHVRSDLYRASLGLVDTTAMKPIMRLGGPIEYTKIGELLTLRIPGT